ncbi:unnamed protein product [Phytophthora fragariaefolia]|uniref:Unnamed protein product n=1 Tax=Phytophthora fragariaefolia TaxID=1490495 RepID=A0A9W6U4X0_9STRA|nr:unnamed protein product [Phytophthora fragariaefolia]
MEFALNNAVHSSTGFTPFYVNGLRNPRMPLTLPPASNLGGGEANAEDPRGLKGLRTSVKRKLLSFIKTGEAVRQRVLDAMAAAQDTQKENSDRHGRANTHVFQMGNQVLLNAKNLPISAVSAYLVKWAAILIAIAHGSHGVASKRTAPTSWPLLSRSTELVGANAAENTSRFYRLQLLSLLYLLGYLFDDDRRDGHVPIEEPGLPLVISDHRHHAKA